MISLDPNPHVVFFAISTTAAFNMCAALYIIFFWHPSTFVVVLEA
jgi:hypothetical protein